MKEARPREAEECPFLVPVTADWIWQRPVGAYCRRPGRRVHVPAQATLTSLCATAAHLACPGYLAEMGRRAPDAEPAPSG